MKSNRIMIKFYYWHSQSLTAYQIGETCPTLQAGMGEGGAVTTSPILLVFRKSRRAQNREDYETWVESETANTLNTFDNGDVRSTTLVVEKKDDCDRG